MDNYVHILIKEKTILYPLQLRGFALAMSIGIIVSMRGVDIYSKRDLKVKL